VNHVSIPSEGSIFSSSLKIPDHSAPHQTSYSMGNSGSSPGVQQLVGEDDHSHLSSGEVMNGLNYTFTAPYAFMVCTEKT